MVDGSLTGLARLNAVRAAEKAERIAAIKADGLDVQAVMQRWAVSESTARRLIQAARN